MIEVPAGMIELVQGGLWSGFVVFVRVGAMMAILPAFGEQSVPVRVKLGLAFAFTVIVTPGIVAVDMPPQRALPGLILAEAGAGLFFGMALRLFVITLQIAGTVAAQSTSLSQLFGGSAGADPQPAMGHLLVIAGLALAATLGLHVRMAEYMIYSYELAPLGEIISADTVADIGISQIGTAFALGVTLAAPFVVASLLYNVTLGVINKAMPQLMVAFVGAPAITAGGLILLMLSAPIMLSVWVKALTGFMSMPFGGAP